MTFSHASLGVNSLDSLYAALVAFVCVGVAFAVLRLLPRPQFARRKSPALLAVRSAGLALLIVGALAFGSQYAGIATF
jgi:hypothetical protein